MTPYRNTYFQGNEQQSVMSSQLALFQHNVVAHGAVFINTE